MWRIFRRPIEAAPENVDAIVKACVVLHNFLCDRQAKSFPRMEDAQSQEQDNTKANQLFDIQRLATNNYYTLFTSHPFSSIPTTTTQAKSEKTTVTLSDTSWQENVNFPHPNCELPWNFAEIWMVMMDNFMQSCRRIDQSQHELATFTFLVMTKKPQNPCHTSRCEQLIYSFDAAKVREKLKNYFSSHGAVPWQNEMINIGKNSND